MDNKQSAAADTSAAVAAAAVPSSAEKRPVGEKESKAMSRSVIIQMVLLLSIGSSLILAGAILAALWTNIFNSLINKEFILSPESKSFEQWKETPFPLYMKFYMFNWTNPAETMHSQAKPHFVQTGPYVFSEHHSKVNVTWNINSTVTFLNVRKWIFLPHLSNGSLSDSVTNLNVIGMTLCSLIGKVVPKKLLPFINRFILMKEPIFITKTVGELLFDGYEDPFLKLAMDIKKLVPDFNIPFDKFAWFYGRNMSATYDGIFNMYTGATDINRLGLLTRWNYSDTVKYFPGECGRVNGSTGELWPVNMVARQTGTIFANDICSSLTLDRGDVFTDANGLRGIQFVGGSSVFSNQSCWCVSGKCHPYGVRDISTCRFGAPAFVSFPHFYLANPTYNEMVSGLKPNASEHQFKISFDQDTGVPLEVKARLQVNIYSQPVLLFNLFNRTLPQAMFPMLWFEQTARVEGPLLNQLKTLNQLHKGGQPFFFFVLAVGLLLGLAGVYLAYMGGWRRKPTHQLLTEEPSEPSETPP